jgi:hypothetical protein
MTPEEQSQSIDNAVRTTREDESERCALLAEDLAGRWERSAAKARAEHTFKYGWFGRKRAVMPRWEKFATDLDAAAHGLRTVARGCREGWDTRKLQAHERGHGLAVGTGVDGDETLKNMRC